MADLPAAIAALRSDVEQYDMVPRYDSSGVDWALRLAGRAFDLLAALDAAQSEAVAKVFVPGPLSQEVGMGIYPLPAGRGLPHGTKLFAAPQAPPAAVLTNPYTGQPRDYRDVESDPAGVLIVEPGAPLKAAPPAAVPAGYMLIESSEVESICRTLERDGDEYGIASLLRDALAAAREGE